MSVAVVIEWLSGALAEGELLSAEDIATAERIQGEAPGEDSAVIGTLLSTFAMEPTYRGTVTPRGQQESSAVAAALVVAAKPAPARAPALRALLARLWAALEERPTWEVRQRLAEDVRRQVRAVSVDDASYLRALGRASEEPRAQKQRPRVTGAESQTWL